MSKHIVSIENEASYSIPELLCELDHDVTNLQYQMSQINLLTIGYNLESTNEDMTQTFQGMLDKGDNIVSKPNQTYYLSKPIYLKNDNQVVDLKGSKVIFSHSQTTPHSSGGRTNHIGVFNLRKPEVLMEKTVTSADIKNGILTLENTTNLEIGDYAKLDIGCYNTVYHEEYLSPQHRALVQIKNIDGNNVHLDYSCDSYHIPPVDYTGKLQIVKPLKGCCIRNIHIIDETPLRNGHEGNQSQIVYPAEDSHYACGGIGIECASGCVIENIKHDYGLFNTVYNSYCSHSIIRNIETTSPRLIAGGEGYTIQNLASFNIHIQGLKGYKTRHTVDISGGGYYFIKDVESIQSYTSDLQFHGQYEHNIYIDGFRGNGSDYQFPYFNAGSGVDFGQASADVKISNSQLKLISSMHLNYIQNLIYDNCHLCILRLTNQVKCVNCQIILTDMAIKVPIKRGQKTYAMFENCDITLSANNYIALYDYLSFNHCQFKNTTETTGEIGILVTQCGQTHFNHNFIDCCLWFSNDDATYGIRQTNHFISNNLIYCYRYGGLYFKDESASHVQASIIGNQFFKSSNYTREDYNPYWLDIDGHLTSDTVGKFVIIGNIINECQENISSLNDGITLSNVNNI